MSLIIDAALVAGSLGAGFLGGKNYKTIETDVSSKIAKYGWVPSLPDQRDFIFTAETSADEPNVVDLTPFLGPVLNQGQVGSCTGNSSSGAIQFELHRQKRAPLTTEAIPSRLFLYYNGRLVEGTEKTDCGAQIRDVVKEAASCGVCLEKLWPYDTSKVTVQPKPQAYKMGIKDVIKKYSQIQDHKSRVACLALGFPFIAGFTVYTSFESAAVAASGVVPMPNETDKVIGGHAIYVVGYNKTNKTYLCRNSWGSAWGQNGNFTIPMDYLDSTSLSSDHWVINA